MLITRFAVSIFSVGLMVLGTNVVSGQNFPNKPIRIISGGVGGGSDFMARLIAEGISGPLGQPVIVDNRTGVIQLEIVAKAPPDGYTLIVSGGTWWTSTPLLQKTSYDPVKDFSPITVVERSPVIVVVNPSVAANSIKELIALAKARPGVLNYGSGSAGTPPHLAAELFKAMAGVDIVRVPYKNFGAVSVNDLIAGRDVQVAFSGPNLVLAHIKSGRLRALAVTTAEPSALFPSLPTVAATGLPGYEYVQITAAYAPARTPDAIIRRLNQEIVRVLNRNDVKEKFISTSNEVVGSSPEQLAALVKADLARLGKVIKDAGIKDD